MKKVLVLGASLHAQRYLNMAMLKLQQHHHQVIGLGIARGEVNGIQIFTEQIPCENLYAITVYLNPYNQRTYYDYILSLAPDKVIFNPGAENRELEVLLEQRGIRFESACTLVLLQLGKF